MKTELEEIKVPVKTEVDPKLTGPCKIYYPDIEVPLRIDIKKALKIQRIITKECDDRFKAIREDL